MLQTRKRTFRLLKRGEFLDEFRAQEGICFMELVDTPSRDSKVWYVQGRKAIVL
jgi:hypothetical protein